MNFSILEKLQAQGQTLSKETLKWMKRWHDMDLESADYEFKELSGSTSINLKIRRLDTTDPQGSKAWGSFVPMNGAANSNAEIAYFSLAAILGYDANFRPCARYELGTKATAVFKSLIDHLSIPSRNQDRIDNRHSILKEIATGSPLRGCVKAKKLDSWRAYDELVNPSAPPTGAPHSSNPIISFLQASNPQPTSGTTVDLGHGYKGDALQLVRECSVLMTLDVLFRQWDRYSGGNLGIAKDEAGTAHFYSTDNGGADISKRTDRNLGFFSRYDRATIERLKELNKFLQDPLIGFVGYTNAQEFVVDLGLYRDLSASSYVDHLKNNLQALLDHVNAIESRSGSNAFLPD